MRARAAAALIGALAAAGCATTEPGLPAVGDVDEEGCTLTRRLTRDPLEEHFSAELRRDVRRPGSPSGAPGVGEGQKLVTTDLYYDIYDCPKITIPEKPRE